MVKKQNRAAEARSGKLEKSCEEITQNIPERPTDQA